MAVINIGNFQSRELDGGSPLLWILNPILLPPTYVEELLEFLSYISVCKGSGTSRSGEDARERSLEDGQGSLGKYTTASFP